MLLAALTGVDELAAAERVRLLRLQPPVDRDDLPRGARPTAELEAAPMATVLVDLERDDDDLLQAMRSATRSNICTAQRKGVTVRAGGAEDLPTFADLVARTSERQAFAPYPPRYYERMWREFARTGDAMLLLAEHGGCATSGVMIICGDTAVYKMGGWSGERTSVHPNELLHWTAMRWGRDCGYRYYDLQGIPVAVARARLAGKKPPEARRGTARLKLGFRGQVRLFSGAYDRSCQGRSKVDPLAPFEN